MISRYTDYMYSYPHKTAYRPFPHPVALAPYLEALNAKGCRASLYFHLPFCHSKCGYCNLFSLSAHTDQLVDAYLRTLERQALQLAPMTQGLTFDGFAVGGGTPLLLEPDKLGRLFRIASIFGVRPADVFTSVETSPEYADELRLGILKEAGTARVSIGIQSFLDGELRALGRQPRRADIYPALERIGQAGFPIFNIDLIYGIKGQTRDSFLLSLREALRFSPNELFVYPLYVRYGTGIQEREDDDTSYKLYLTARDYLSEHGFRQTSMRRFVRHAEEGHSCGDEVMLSCGAGGRSYLGPLHYATRYAVHPGRIREIIDQYLQTEDFTMADNGFILSPDEQARRYIIKNLLYHTGIDKHACYVRHGVRLEDYPQMQMLADRHWVEDVDGHIRLTDEGMGYSDYIGQLFISPAVRTLMSTYAY